MLHSPTVPNTEKSLGANCLECYLQVSLVVWQVTGRNMAPAISETIHLQQQQWGSIFSQFDDQSLIHSHSSGYLHWWDSILNICQQVETDSPLLLLTWTSPAFPVFFFTCVLTQNYGLLRCMSFCTAPRGSLWVQWWTLFVPTDISCAVRWCERVNVLYCSLFSIIWRFR